jgi:hypothetical protein
VGCYLLIVGFLSCHTVRDCLYHHFFSLCRIKKRFLLGILLLLRGFLGKTLRLEWFPNHIIALLPSKAGDHEYIWLYSPHPKAAMACTNG